MNRSALVAEDRGGLRAVAIDSIEAGLEAVDPRRATRAAIEGLRGDGVALEDVIVIAVGKAARGMAEGALDLVPAREGIVVGFEDGALGPLRMMASSHPVPDARSVAAGEAALEVARRARAGDVVLCLVSGGGSAMLEAPEVGVDLDAIRARTRELLGSGAPIEEINEARRALSRVKGGRLAEAIAPARIVNVILSDVPGSGPEVVASGPTIPAPGSGIDSVTRVAGDNLTARRAMAAAARARGLRVIEREGFARGEAREVGAAFYEACAALDADVVVWGGETTVEVRGDGVGGRNQELALGAAARFRGGLVASVGTDGVDGASDAAGALLDAEVLAKARDRRLEPKDFLARNDADSFFAQANGRIVTGRTGTNVADVCVYVAVGAAGE